MKDSLIKDYETLDDLEYQGLKIIQDPHGYKFSTDSVLLANFGRAKQSDVYVDLCSGSGVVAILFSCKNKIQKGYCVEIQDKLADMCNRSILYNNLDDRLSVLNIDLKDCLKTIKEESVDVITVNPPYNTNGVMSDIGEIAMATHEVKITWQEIVQVSSKILKYGGKLFLVHRADRLIDVVDALRNFKIEPKVLRVVYPKVSKEPNLILIEAKKGAKPGLKIMQPLVLNTEDGLETEELKKSIREKIKNRNKPPILLKNHAN